VLSSENLTAQLKLYHQMKTRAKKLKNDFTKKIKTLKKVAKANLSQYDITAFRFQFFGQFDDVCSPNY
jgi:DNA-binding ferritin-like protein (Dps family)